MGLHYLPDRLIVKKILSYVEQDIVDVYKCIRTENNYYPSIFRLAHKKFEFDKQVAEDVCSNTFFEMIGTIRNKKGFDFSKGKLSTFYYSIGQNRCLNINRKTSNQDKHNFKVEKHFYQSPKTLDKLNNDLDAPKIKYSMGNLLDEILKPKEKNLILAVYYSRIKLVTYSEISEINLNTVKTTHKSALKKLRQDERVRLLYKIVLQ